MTPERRLERALMGSNGIGLGQAAAAAGMSQNEAIDHIRSAGWTHDGTRWQPPPGRHDARVLCIGGDLPVKRGRRRYFVAICRCGWRSRVVTGHHIDWAVETLTFHLEPQSTVVTLRGI